MNCSEMFWSPTQHEVTPARISWHGVTFVFFLSQLFWLHFNVNNNVYFVTFCILILIISKCQTIPSQDQKHLNEYNEMYSYFWLMDPRMDIESIPRTRGCFLSEKNSLKIYGFIASLLRWPRKRVQKLVEHT